MHALAAASERKNRSAATQRYWLLRIDLDGDKGVLVAVAGGLRHAAVEVNRETPGRARREREFRCGPGRDPLLDVVAVQVHGRRLVRTPLQLDDIALRHADETHVFRNAAALDTQGISDLGGLCDHGRSGEAEGECDWTERGPKPGCCEG